MFRGELRARDVVLNTTKGVLKMARERTVSNTCKEHESAAKSGGAALKRVSGTPPRYKQQIANRAFQEGIWKALSSPPKRKG